VFVLSLLYQQVCHFLRLIGFGKTILVFGRSLSTTDSKYILGQGSNINSLIKTYQEIVV